jgi:hypothetical protein
MASQSPSPQQSRRGSTVENTSETPRRFQNGWSKEQDKLMADWSDIAGCYRWMHDRAEKMFTKKNMFMTIPVIILSTLTGTASVGIGSIAGDNEEFQKYLNFGIGGVSLIAGILTTLNNFLRFAQLSESHKVAGVAWGKFQRLIAVELALKPDERMDSLDFLKICRADLDRLIEQSPPIPDSIIAEFEKEFKDRPNLRRPDICHGLDHTHVYDNSQSRLKALTSDAALTLMHKKRVLRQEILPDLDKLIEGAVRVNLEKKKQEIEDAVKAATAANEGASRSGGRIDPSGLLNQTESKLKDLVSLRRKQVSVNPMLSISESLATGKGTGNEMFSFTNPLNKKPVVQLGETTSDRAATVLTELSSAESTLADATGEVKITIGADMSATERTDA